MILKYISKDLFFQIIKKSQQLSSFLCGVGINIVLNFLFLFLQEYWFLTKSRISLKPVLEGMRIVALSISSNEQTQ